ncbi:CLUMA_CG010498, isoform A [Clunio marinus]|uniref:CLUMA_CG010498, isoform A n=1 Tax=Clunio marinus TaxID=568069 RepID=A0A1J1I9X2_9DIPT|nr:CLUMA_CG010498, isoform A [Clunio marinus]
MRLEKDFQGLMQQERAIVPHHKHEKKERSLCYYFRLRDLWFSLCCTQAIVVRLRSWKELQNSSEIAQTIANSPDSLALYFFFVKALQRWCCID